MTSFSGVEIVPLLPDESMVVEIPEEGLDISFSRAGGKGGQNVNKVENAVQITHIPTGVTVRCSGMADLIMVNSRFTASTFAGTFKHLHARGMKPAVLYPVVNVEQFDKHHAFKFNFLSVNRFERKKNVELAISAFSLLQTLGGDVQGLNVANATLTGVGGFDKRVRENVEYLEELKSLADRKGVSHQVKLMTSCSTAERNMLLSQCSAFFIHQRGVKVQYHPQDEHFGIVPLVAMAAYKPVIACNSGGPMEMIKNGVTGFLSDASPQELSSAIEKFTRDPQMAERMGSEARQHVVESFSTKIFGQHLNQILLDIARGKED